jgi:hypothetical protein
MFDDLQRELACLYCSSHFAEDEEEAGVEEKAARSPTIPTRTGDFPSLGFLELFDGPDIVKSRREDELVGLGTL